jgi:hypothetical protein
MVILSLSETTPVTLLTPWGKENGICYQGSSFLPVNSYQNLEDAIVVCRRDLDVGLMSIIVNEANQVRIWSPLPDELIKKGQQGLETKRPLAKAS